MPGRMPGKGPGECGMDSQIKRVDQFPARLPDQRQQNNWFATGFDYNEGMEDTTINDEESKNEESEQLVSREEVQTALGRKRDLSGMDLSGLDLSGMKLTGLNASGINLSGANLSGGVIAAANVDQINVAGAELEGTVIAAANLAGANFQGANLRGAKIQMTNLDSADFTGADLTDSLWMATNVSNADFSETKTAGSRSSGVAWATAKTLPAELPEPLISTPRWAPFAVLGLAGTLLAFLFFRRRKKPGYIPLDAAE